MGVGSSPLINSGQHYLWPMLINTHVTIHTEITRALNVHFGDHFRILGITPPNPVCDKHPSTSLPNPATGDLAARMFPFATEGTSVFPKGDQGSLLFVPLLIATKVVHTMASTQR